MAKKKKKRTLNTLTKKEKQKIQETIRTNAGARREYAEAVGEAVKASMNWVRDTTDNYGEVSIYIDAWPENLAKEIEFILELVTGEDIITTSKKDSDERWGITKRFDILNL